MKKGLYVLTMFAVLILLLSSCNPGLFTSEESDTPVPAAIAEAPSLTTDASSSSAYTFAVMAPLHVTNWADFENRLDVANSMGVQAVSVDVWWGDVEAEGDQAFNWSYYDTIFSKITDAGLDIVAIMSFHQCGGNVGDDYTAYVPSWIWDHYSELSAADMQYRSETGAYSGEYVSLWADEYVVEEYVEFMNAFEDRYGYLASDIDELNVSGGPAGELRYPSYNSHDWGGYPNRGTIQAYSTLAVAHFQNAMLEKYGSLSGINAAWNENLASISQVTPPSDTDWFFHSNDYEDTQYGRDFIDWYNGSLTEHGQRMMQAAFTAFDNEFSSIPIGMKIPGIHWRMADPDYPRLAEITAGLIRTSVDYSSSASGHGYNNILSAFTGHSREVNLHFTCLEMGNEGTSPAYSMAEDLVFWVADAAEALNIEIKGENALAGGVGNDFGWDQINNAFEHASYSGLTVLRIANVTSGGTGQYRYTQLLDQYSGNDGWDSLYLRGSHNSWGTQSMTQTGDTWSATASFAAGDRFKFDVTGDWSENYGDDNSDGFIDSSGDDILIPSAGSYTISLNEATGEYIMTQNTDPGNELTLHFREWESASTYLVHTWNGLSGNDIPMQYEGYFNDGHWWEVTIQDVPDHFMFCFTNSNSNWDSVNRSFDNQASEVYVVYGDSTLYASRP
ncbi:MAG: family 14 glycosylhydrolase [Spirochaetia bacterium]